jgi:hypothetical protein
MTIITTTKQQVKLTAHVNWDALTLTLTTGNDDDDILGASGGELNGTTFELHPADPEDEASCDAEVDAILASEGLHRVGDNPDHFEVAR